MKKPKSRTQRLADRAKAEKQKQLVRKIADQLPPVERIGNLGQLRDYYAKKFAIGIQEFAQPRYLWAAVRGNEQQQILVRTSREHYIEALELIAWLWEELSHAPNKTDLIVELFKMVGVKPSRKWDVLSLIARSVIDYGAGEHARKIWVRDAAAIRYLKEIGVPTNGFVDHWRQHGGGPDPWQRAFYERNPKRRAKESKARPTVKQEAMPSSAPEPPVQTPPASVVETQLKDAPPVAPAPTSAASATETRLKDAPPVAPAPTSAALVVQTQLKSAPMLVFTTPDPHSPTGFKSMMQETFPADIDERVIKILHEAVTHLCHYYRRGKFQDGTFVSTEYFRPEDHLWWPNEIAEDLENGEVLTLEVKKSDGRIVCNLSGSKNESSQKIARQTADLIFKNPGEQNRSNRADVKPALERLKQSLAKKRSQVALTQKQAKKD